MRFKLENLTKPCTACVGSTANIAGTTRVGSLCAMRSNVSSSGMACQSTSMNASGRKMRCGKSEAKFRDYAETASDWFWEIGPDYKFTLLTENAFGSRSADRIGTTCWDHALDVETEPEKWRLSLGNP